MGKRFDDHPSAILAQRIAHMGCCAYRITHVVETIEHRNQIVVLARKLFGLRDAKVEANLETFSGGDGAGALDRFVVIVKSEELRFWEGFGHQHCRCSLATAHIGDTRAGLELSLYTLQRGNPRTCEVRGIAGPEEFLAAMKHIIVVFMPAHPCAGAEGLDNPGNSAKRAESQLEGAGNIGGTVFVRQCKRLFFAQTELASLFVIRHVAAGSLGAQPFAYITLICPGLCSQFGGVHGAAFSESLV